MTLSSTAVSFLRRYCLGGDLITECPEGYYCPAGTGVDWQPCPVGTFSNQTGLSQDSQCLPCTGGQYCGQLALTAPSAPCDSGYYCEYGLDRAQPSGSNATLVNGTCEMPGEIRALFFAADSVERDHHPHTPHRHRDTHTHTLEECFWVRVQRGFLSERMWMVIPYRACPFIMWWVGLFSRSGGGGGGLEWVLIEIVMDVVKPILAVICI